MSSCQRTTFLVFSLTEDSKCVYFNALVWWKLKLRWWYCIEYIRISPFLMFYISKGSVATQLRRGGKYDNNFIARSLLNPSVKEILKSANIWQSYKRKISLVFSDSQCINIKYRNHITLLKIIMTCMIDLATCSTLHQHLCVYLFVPLRQIAIILLDTW